MLFLTYRFCASSAVTITKSLTGSFLCVKQVCTRCKRTWHWESQPFIQSFPVGNVLMSAAILYSGSLPAKALRMFHILKCATITPNTLFRHQSQILQPAVKKVWEKEQLLLMNTIRKEKRNLFLSGDGRCDSPGHSAKFGSYTIIDIFSDKVVDFKLVQVRLRAYNYDIS